MDIIFVLSPSAKSLHKNFLKKYMYTDPKKFKMYWLRRVFTGKGQITKLTQTEKETIEFVEKTPGAIGYVFRESVTSYSFPDDDQTGIKIVSISNGSS